MHTPPEPPPLPPAPPDAAAELFLHHPVPLWVYDRESLAFLAVNHAAAASYGYSREQFLAMSVADILHEPGADELRAMRQNPGRRRSWRQNGVRQHRKADGSVIHAEITSHDLAFRGRPAVAVAAYDVTARIAAEQAAREAEHRLNEAQQLAQLGSWRWTIATDAVVWSEQLFAIAGLPPASGAPSFTAQRTLYGPADWIRLLAVVERTLNTGEPYQLQLEMVRPDGTTRTMVARGAPVRDAAGQIVALHGTAQDVTERCVQDALLSAADEKLHESETRYRELVESLDDVVFSTDASGTVQYCSSGVEHFGYTAADLTGRPFTVIVHPDDAEAVRASFHETLSGVGVRREFRVVSRDGRTHHVRCSSRARRHDTRPTTVTGILCDITEQRRAQEQLRAAGRLDAVGRLAGGVAHDFNNLLVAINGFAELALLSAPDGNLRDDLTEILKAGNRAAALTSQLLAFSRRQVLRPDSVILNDVITSMAPMLRRLLGEDITFEISCEPRLRHVRIDAGQLEQVIMNLAVNARDAMPAGGRLRIDTSEATASGDDGTRAPAGTPLAVITVSDSGEGMDEATQAQIFEPFFTTKPRGQGTGLGLAMVYGFVKQSGGSITVRSAHGHGTTFRIALPQDGSPRATAVVDQPLVTAGSETILVTEDEEMVRTIVERVLRGAGYKVLVADGAEAALRICRTYEGPIDLLLTDVVMPHTSGPVLAEQVRPLRPQMAVLFMSGYSGNEISARGLLQGSMPFLQKPFNAGSLSEAVRQALSSPSSSLQTSA